MNKHRYRLIFSKVRRMLVPVAEITTSHAKDGARGAGGPSSSDSDEEDVHLGAAPNWHLRRAVVVALGVTVGLPLSAWAGALPQGGVVVGGAASITTPNANQMVITQSTQRAAINWNSFNVGAGDSVRFAQPSSKAQTLNRVVGMTGSTQIAGQLTANGQVFIVNPQGVVFGKGAVVNAGAVVASTKDVDPAAFMSRGGSQVVLGGKGTSGGVVENDGTITTQAGGYVVLAGDQVKNNGRIQAANGTVALAAGDQATLALSNGQLVCVTLGASAAQAGIQNGGVIQAQGGTVVLTANAAGALLDNAINLSGLIDVSGKTGGRVVVNGGAQGGVDLNGAQINASGSRGNGGTVTVTGQNVALRNGTTINATGATGGGTVLVGGGLHGEGPLTHAETVSMDSTSRIDASATRKGNGGTVVLWSDKQTTFEGAITVRGGLLGGNGGMVETSSKNQLVFNPVATVDTRAPHGTWGTLLLDPLNIQITHGAAGNPTSSMVNAVNATTNSSITDGEIMAELASGNVQLTASNIIYDDATVNVTSASAGSLSMTAYETDLAGLYNVAGGLALNASSTTSTITGTITGSGGLTVSGGGKFALLSNNSYTGQTTISGATTTLIVGNGTAVGSLGTGAIVDGGNLVFNTSGPQQVGGAISGSGSVQQAGSGTTHLSGANTYSGTTVISAGTLQVDTSGSLGTGAVTDNSHLVFNQSGNTTVAGAISGGGDITQQGTGNTLFAQNVAITRINQSAGTAIFGGNVTLTSGLTGTGGVVQIGNGGAGSLTFNAAISTTGNVLFNSAGTVTDSQAITAGNLTVSGATTVTLNGTLNASGSLLFNSTGTSTVNGVISGAASLTTNGSGNTILTAVNTYTGTNTINAGSALEVRSGGGLGTGAVMDSGTLNLNTAAAATFANNISGPGNLIKNGGGVTYLNGVTNYTGTTTDNGTWLQINGAGLTGTSQIIDNAGIIFNLSAPATFAAPISGAGQVQQAGANLTLSGNNTYTGTTTVNGGDWLIAGSATAFGTGGLADNGNVDLHGFNVAVANLSGSGTLLNNGANATLNLTGTSANAFFSGVVKDGTGTVAVSVSGNNYYWQVFRGNNTYSGGTTVNSNGWVQIQGGGTLGSGNVTDNGRLYFNAVNSPLTFANNISGSGTLTVDVGGGKVVLSGNNSYTGTTTVSTGTLDVATESALYGGNTAAWTASNIKVAANATLEVRPGNGTLGTGFTNADIVTLVGNLNAASGGFANGSYFGVDTANGNYTLSATLTNTAQGTLGLVADGGKTLTVTGANTYTGLTNVINNTTLSSTGTALATTSVNLSANATYDALGQNATIGSLQGTGTVTDNGANATLTVGADNSTQNFSGVIKNGPAAGGGVLSLTKVGTGTQNITGANTYSGVTTISCGSLGGNFGNTSQIINNSNLTFSQSNTTVFNYNYSGTGNLIQAGTGTTILASNITLQGKILVQCGTLDFATESSLFGGDTSQWNANRILVSNGATLAVMTGNGTYGTGFTTSDITTLLSGLNASSGGFAAGAAFGIDTSNGNYTLPFALGDTQQGALGLTAVGNHTLFLNSTNTNTGPTSVLGGATLDVQSSTAVSASSLVNVYTNGTLIVDAAGTNFGNVTLCGTLVANASGLNINCVSMNAGMLDLHGYNVAVATLLDGTSTSFYGVTSGGGTITDSSTVAGMLTVGSSNANSDFSGTIQDGAGKVSLNKVGTGTLSIGNAQRFSGGTTISCGSISLVAGSSYYQGAGNLGSGTITMLGGSLSSTQAYNPGFTRTLSNAINVSANSSIAENWGASWLQLSGPISVANGVTLSTGGNVYITGAITGGGGLAVTSGTTLETGNNAYTGATTIASGATLQVNGGNGPGVSSLVTDNGALIFNTTGNFSTSSDVVGTGSLTKNGAGTATVTGNYGLAGTTTINNGTLQVGNGTAGNWTATGSVTDNSNLVLDVVNTATLQGLTGTGSANLTVTNGSLNFTQPVNLSGASSTLTASASNGMAVSANLSATAGINLTTQLGNLTVGGNLTASAGNITLAAGQSGTLGLASGADTAGDVIVTNPGSVTAKVGVGKTLAIYSGNANSSTLQTLAPGALYNKDFGSNESTATPNANFGINLMYRTVPVLPLANGTTATDHVYNGSAQVAVVLSPGSHTTTFDGDTYTFNFNGGVGNGTAASDHVGCWAVSVAPTAAAVTPGTLGSCVSGYGNVSMSGLTVNITPATLTVTAAGGSKTYDGTVASNATANVTGFVGNDSLAGKVGETYASSHVLGAGNSTLVSNTLTNASVAGGGYITDYTVNYVNAAGTITPATVTLTANNQSKTYGTSDPTLSYIVAGLQGNDTISALNLTGNLGRVAGEGVGNYAITHGSLLYSDADYVMTINTTGAYETIKQTNLTVTVTGQNTSKVYGTNDQLLPYTTAGVINTTVQSFDANGNLINVSVNDASSGAMSGNLGRQSGENVGLYALTLGNLSFSNSNYALVLNPAGANETITAANLTVTASNDSKTYGTNDPTLAYTTSGLVNGTVQSYDASGKLINVALSDTTGSVLNGSLGRASGEGVGNYAITNGSLGSNANYNLTINTTGANETITAATLTVTASNASKTYGTSDQALAYTTSALVNTTVQSRDASGNLVNVALADTAANVLTGNLGRTAGENVGNYAITNGSLAANGNYALTINTTGANETITAAALTVTASNASKVYGTNDPTLLYNTTGLVNGTVRSYDANGNLVNVALSDTAATALTGSLGRASGEGVGNYAITSGSLAANADYALTINLAGANETISAAALSVNASNDSKTYGTNDPTLAYTTAGLVNTTVQSRDASGNLINVSLSDTAASALTGSLGRASGEGVGNYAITNGSLAANGNYALTINTTGANETITAAMLTVDASNASKTYGTNDATLAYTTSGLVNGTVQSRDASGNLVNVALADTTANVLTGNLGRTAGENVGNYAITNGSLAANGNYALTINTTGANETITAAALTVTASNASKTYGTNDPTLAYTTTGLVNGTVKSYDANGNLINVALADTTANTLTGNLGRVAGEGVGNYALTNGSLAANADYALTINLAGANETITAAALSVNASNDSKTYGTNDPTLAYTTTGLVNSTVQSYDANGNLINVALADTAATALTGSLGRASGEGVGNYAITNGSLAANGNYALTINTTGANETITTAALTVNASNASKTYGTNDPTLAYTTSGLVNNTVQSRDANGNLVNVSLSDTVASTLTGNLGRASGEGVGNYAITNGSLAANGNYALTINTTGANETITAAALTVNASNDTKTYGTNDPTLAYTTSGLVNTTVQSRDANGNLVNVSLNDTAATALTGSLGRQSGEGVGNYAITNGSLAANGNYALTINTTGVNETITAAALTVNASNVTKVYGSDDPTLAYTTAGLVNGTVKSRDANGNLVNVSLSDTAATALTGNLGRQSGEDVGNYAITNGSLAANGNYALTINTTGANETITKANLAVTVTAENATKVYGTDDPTLNYTISGLVQGSVKSWDSNGTLTTVNMSNASSTSVTGNLGRQSGEGVGKYAITAGSIALTGNGSSAYNLVINTTNAFETITAANLSVTAYNATKTYGTNDPTLAYITSGLINNTVQSRDANGNLVNVSLTDTAATALTGNLGRVAGEGVGNYAITNGSLAANGNYALTINTTGANETITAAALSVNASNDTKTYGTDDPTLAYTTSGLVNTTVQSRDANGNLVNVSLNDTAATALTGSLGRQSGEGVGNYAITNGSLAANGNYALTINTTGTNETITAAALTVNASNASKTYGIDDPTLAYTTSGLVNTTVQSRDANGNLVNVSLSDTVASTLTGNLGRQSGEGVGNYAITNGSLAANGNYALTINTTGANETITAAALTVNASNDTKTYGTNDPTLAYTTSGLVNTTVQSRDANGNLVNVSLSDTVASTLTGNLGRQSGEGVGNYAITNGSLAANGNYTLTIDTTGANETITAANLMVNASNDTKTYGTDDPTLAYTTSGLVNTTVQSRDANGNLVNVSLNDTAATALTGSLGRQSGEGVGNYAITNGSLAANGNYALTINTTGTNETITAAALTVNASNASKTYGIDDPTLAYTTSGLVNTTVQSRDANGNLVNVSLSDTVASTLTGNLGRQSGEGVGNYAITNGSLAANGNYALTINTTSANETITAAALTVNASNDTKTYGTDDPTLAYTTSGLVNTTVQSRDASGNLINVALADTTANTLTGNLGRVAGEGVGNYAITNGSLAANGNYALTINTTGANETITAAALSVNASNDTKTYGTDDPTLAYTTAGLVNGTVQSRDANGNLVNVSLNDTAATALTGSLGRQSGEGVGNYAITSGSLAANGNYALTINTTGANETITAATLTVTPQNASKAYGTNDPTLAYATSGLVNTTVQSRDASGNLVNVALADTVATALTGNLGRVAGENAGDYAFTQGGLQATANYALALDTVGKVFTINPAPVMTTTIDGIRPVAHSALAALLRIRVPAMFQLTNRGWVAADQRDGDLESLEQMTAGYLPESLTQKTHGLPTWHIESTGVHLADASGGLASGR